MSTNDKSSTDMQDDKVEVVNEVNNEPKVGEYTGQCKWWSDKLGYGFVTVVSNGDKKGKDIFLHHTGIRPLNSNYRTLRKGEYINFDIIDGANGLQGTNVTGIGGGSLICDVNPYIKPVARVPLPPPPPPFPQRYHNGPPPRTIANSAFVTHISNGLQTPAYRAGRPYSNYRQRPAPTSTPTSE